MELALIFLSVFYEVEINFEIWDFNYWNNFIGIEGSSSKSWEKEHTIKASMVEVFWDSVNLLYSENF